MLWRRRDAEKEAAGEAEGRQEEDAPVRQGRNPADGVHSGAEDGWVRLARYYQTIARIGAGLATLTALTLTLWNGVGGVFEEREELFAAFLIALAAWIFTEVKESEEVIFRNSTVNDIRLGRELLSYAADKFRVALKDHDYHNGLHTRYFSELNALVHEYEVGVLDFQDRALKEPLSEFMRALTKFSMHMDQSSAPYGTGAMLQRIIPPDDFAKFDAFGSLPNHLMIEVKQANDLAGTAWNRLEQLVAVVKTRVPEVFDEAISYQWYRSSDS
jgi:hypothetical protein